MKTLCEYKFKNKKTIRISMLTVKDKKFRGIPECDDFLLTFIGKEETGMALRADEMLQMITLLGYALFTGVSAFKVGKLRGYNGFKFM